MAVSASGCRSTNSDSSSRPVSRFHWPTVLSLLAVSTRRLSPGQQTSGGDDAARMPFEMADRLSVHSAQQFAMSGGVADEQHLIVGRKSDGRHVGLTGRQRSHEFAGLGIPQSGALVVAASQHELSVVRNCRRSAAARVIQPQHLAASRYVPDPSRIVGRSGQHLFAAGKENRGRGQKFMSFFEAVQFAARLNRPGFGRAISTGRDDGLAVGREMRRQDRVGVPFEQPGTQHALLFISFDIP